MVDPRQISQVLEDDGTWHVHLERVPGAYRVALWRRVAGSPGTYEFVGGSGAVVRLPQMCIELSYVFAITEDEVAGIMVRRLLAALAAETGAVVGEEGA